jgi:class III poly(R)-hydroxyalkanoic acid synthase PhaE subunit
VEPDPWQQWQQFVRPWIESATQGSAPAAGGAAEAFSDFLRDRFGKLQTPWASGFGAGMARDPAPSFGGDWPALGAAREHQQRLQRIAEAVQRLDEAQRRLQRLWSDALREAAAAFAARLASNPPGSASTEALRALYDAWIDCAEDAYAHIAHSEPFCGALADYVNASTQWRQEVQASTEHLSKLLDLPTRSEINTLIQRLNALEERLRVAPQGPEPPSAAPRRKRSTRRAAKR